MTTDLERILADQNLTLDDLEQHLIQLELIKEKALALVQNMDAMLPCHNEYLELKEILQLCQPQSVAAD
jgi:hypothetical protein